jgi:hypothetical protein
MTSELTRVEPLRAANVGALVYGAMMLVFALMFVSFIPFMPSHDRAGNPINRLIFAGFVAFYPIFGVVAGWLLGLIGAWIYNFVAHHYGGFRFVLLASDPSQGVEGRASTPSS